MKKLTIQNPASIWGQNFSAAFRGGDLSKEVIAGEEVQLVDGHSQDLAFAEVVDIWAGPLGHYPALLAEMACDPLQRTFTGLLTHLMVYRGKNEVTPLTTPMTILILKAKESTIIRPTHNQIKNVENN